MKSPKFAFALLLLIGLCGKLQADETSITIDDFSFLTGYWQGEGFGGDSEEMWMPPVDGKMFGIFKQSANGELIFTEFMEITQSEGDWLLRLKHFNPDFSGWEEKSDFITFPLQLSNLNKQTMSKSLLLCGSCF